MINSCIRNNVNLIIDIIHRIISDSSDDEVSVSCTRNLICFRALLRRVDCLGAGASIALVHAASTTGPSNPFLRKASRSKKWVWVNWACRQDYTLWNCEFGNILRLDETEYIEWSQKRNHCIPRSGLCSCWNPIHHSDYSTALPTTRTRKELPMT